MWQCPSENVKGTPSRRTRWLARASAPLCPSRRGLEARRAVAATRTPRWKLSRDPTRGSARAAARWWRLPRPLTVACLGARPPRARGLAGPPPPATVETDEKRTWSPSSPSPAAEAAVAASPPATSPSRRRRVLRGTTSRVDQRSGENSRSPETDASPASAPASPTHQTLARERAGVRRLVKDAHRAVLAPRARYAAARATPRR